MTIAITIIGILTLIVLMVGATIYNVYKGRKNMGIK